MEITRDPCPGDFSGTCVSRTSGKFLFFRYNSYKLHGLEGLGFGA